MVVFHVERTRTPAELLVSFRGALEIRSPFSQGHMLQERRVTQVKWADCEAY